MKSPVTRIVIAAVAVIAIFAGAMYSSNKGGVHREIRLPEKSLETIPMEFGKWKGRKTEIDEKLFRGIAGYEVISRIYSNPVSDDEITFHCAVFNTFWRRVPHSPKVCYPASGWTTIRDEPFEIEGSPDPQGKTPTARLAAFEKDGNKIFVLFWFRIGDYVVTDASELASARWQYRNEEKWPPVVKMMLQISADNPERAKRQLREFANELYKITKEFN